MRRVWLLVAMLLLLTFPVSAKNVTENELTYHFMDQATVSVTYDHQRADTLEGRVVIPNSINTWSVKAIGAMAFADCRKVTQIVLPDSIISIDAEAFRGCSGMTRIVLPSRVETVGESAFAHCTALTEVVVEYDETQFADSAFEDCPELTLICNEGSTAHRFATEHGIAVEFIGQLDAIEEKTIEERSKEEKRSRFMSDLLTIGAVVAVGAVIWLIRWVCWKIEEKREAK